MDAVDKIVFINLDSRTDRLAEIRDEMAKLGVLHRAERFAAIAHSRGSYGCALSHLAVLKSARDDPAVHRLAVFEDDFEIVGNPEDVLSSLAAFNDSFGAEFDVLFLAVSIIQCEPCRTLPNGKEIVRVTRGQTTGGYIINRRSFDALISLWEGHLDTLLATGISHSCPDLSWFPLQVEGTWLAFAPRFAKQRASYSDIEKRHVDYGV